MSQVERSIGLVGAIAIGIGGMVGGGIFAVLGEAVSLAKGATPVAFTIAGLVALLTAYAYAKLSVTYQSRGGTVVFIDKAFRHNLLSGSMNFMLWLSYLVTISLYAMAFAYYGETFFSEPHSALLHHGLISAAIVLSALINWVSASFVSRTETFFVALKLGILLLVIVTGLGYVKAEALSPQHWEAPLAIFVAGMVIFVAYEGFELIANSAEEIKDPERNLPRAFYGAVLIVIAVYVLIAVVTVGAVPMDQLMAAKDYALALAAEPAMGQVGFTLVAIAALLSTFSAINATIYGNARLGYIVAKEGRLPQILAKESRHQPVVGIFVTAGLSLLLANSISLTEIAILGSASFLLVFLMVNISALRLHKQVRGNPLLFFLATLMSFFALAVLLWHTYEQQPMAVVLFCAFILFSIVFEAVYGRWVRGHFFYRTYTTAAGNLVKKRLSKVEGSVDSD